MANIHDHPRVLVGGLETARLSRKDMVAQMVADCANARVAANYRPRLVFTVNGHSVALAATSTPFHNLLDAADILHADGQPIVLASRLLTSTPIPERSATTDLIHDAAAAAQRHGLRFYLLGGTEQANALCAKALRESYPNLVIAGRRNGYFAREEEAAICEEITRCHPDIVWVGMGVPFEQEFCVRNRHQLEAGWLVSSGGCFNFVTGEYVRAPRWIQTAGLEWLHRLLREPKRLGPRYLLTNPVAAFLLLFSTASLPGSRG